MAHLIEYLHRLQADESKRIIIFSQWDKLLQKVGETLTATGIKNVFCKVRPCDTQPSRADRSLLERPAATWRYLASPSLAFSLFSLL